MDNMMTCKTKHNESSLATHTLKVTLALSGVIFSTLSHADYFISGNTISWPDNGWYQVQDANSYESICEGGRSCTVADGLYTIINHHSGRRFERIAVPVTQSETEPAEETTSTTSLDSARWSWSLQANLLSFANTTDWYQVQQSMDFQNSSYRNICEGQTSCAVEDGRYQIVNHSTGEVWQEVGVGTQAVSWTTISAFEISIFWRDIIYNLESPVYYDVQLNGQSVGTSTGNSLRINNITRGTQYTAAVFGHYSDGTQRLVGENQFVTEGPSAALAGYGKPANQNTFNFEHWDSIPTHLQSAFPSDCLFAIGWSSICYSPSTRFLMEINHDRRSTEGSATVKWEYPLPGDNDTNHIEALAVLYTSYEPHSFTTKTFAIVADVTNTFGQSSYEISRFSGSGEFNATYPILSSIQGSGSTVMGRQINLDGADLQVTRGPRRDVTVNNPFLDSDPRRLHVVGEYYETNGSGNVSDLSGWSRMGAFLAIVDSITGETVSQQFYPGQRMADVSSD